MTSDSSRLLAAATFAAEKHCDQRRKDPTASPYINHPLAVAATLAGHGGVTNVELLMAAILHDTVEDTATATDELTRCFGETVSRLVCEVTDDQTLPKAQRKRKQVESAPHKTELAKQLKIADKICNVRDIDTDSPAGWDANRKTEYLAWAEQVVEGCRGVNEKLDRLFDEVLASTKRRLG